MSWLTKNNGKENFTTTITSRDKKEFDMRVQDLVNRGWTILSSDTCKVRDAMMLSSTRRGARGMGRTSSSVMVEGSVTKYWCKLESPHHKQKVV